jgi:rubrerythrin
MAYRNLPVPEVARPLPRLDPYRHRAGFIRVLSSLYHAEAAAMEGFTLMNQPLYVQSSEMFTSACKRLIADERQHLLDIEDMIRRLGGDGVTPPTPVEARFWKAWRSGRLFALPFKPSIAAAFCLFSEGLGYAFLYNLAQATADPEIAKLLWANVKDEEMHLRISLTVLRRALEQENGVLADFLIHLYGYMMLAREPIREQRALLASIGLDFDIIVGSSIRFLFDLLHVVVRESGQDNLLWRKLGAAARGLGGSPDMVKLLHVLMFVPDIPFSRRAVFEWGRLSLWLRGLRPTTAAQIEAMA